MSSFKKNAYTFATIVAMGGFVFGLDAALISGTIGFITEEFGLSDWQIGTVVSAPALGVIIALPFAGLLSNGFGRKKTLQFIALLYVISAIGSALASSYWMLLIARLLGGLAFSSITLAAMYIGEIAPPKWRGKLVSMNQINIVVGLSMAYFINYAILQLTQSGADWVQNWGIVDNTWRWMLGAEILPAFLWFVLLFVIPKSPSWLLLKERVDEAKASFGKFYPDIEIPQKVQEVQESILQNKNNGSIGSQLKQIFGKRMRIILIVATTIAVAQQTTGINAILFYAPTVIEQIGIGRDAAFLQAVWIGLTGLVFTIFSIMFVDRVGRRPMILGGMIWIIVSLAMCSWGFKSATYSLSTEAISQLTEIPNADQLNSLVGEVYQSDIEFKSAISSTIGEENARSFSSVLLTKAANMNAILILLGILSFVAAFHFSVGPIMWVLFSEMFPTTLRGIAIPLFAVITSVTSYLIQQFFPWQLATMGGSAIFLFYAVTVGIGFLILYFYLPETKNMTIEQIQLAFKRKKS